MPTLNRRSVHARRTGRLVHGVDTDSIVAHRAGIAEAHHGVVRRPPTRRARGHDAVSASGDSPPDDGSSRTRACTGSSGTPLILARRAPRGVLGWRARAVASHRSAAALWELPGARRDIVEITCPRWRRAQHDGLVVHESLALDAERRPTRSTAYRSRRSSARSSTCARVVADVHRRPGDRQRAPAAADRPSTSSAARSSRARDARTAGTAPVPPSCWRVARTRAAHHQRASASSMLLRVRSSSHGLPEPVPPVRRSVTTMAGSFVARVDLAYPRLARSRSSTTATQHHVGRARTRS